MAFCNYTKLSEDVNQPCYVCEASKCKNGRLKCYPSDDVCSLTADCKESKLAIDYRGLQEFTEKHKLCGENTGIKYSCDDEDKALLQCRPAFLSGTFQFKFTHVQQECVSLKEHDKYYLQGMKCSCTTCECVFCENHDLQCSCTVESLSETTARTKNMPFTRELTDTSFTTHIFRTLPHVPETSTSVKGDKSTELNLIKGLVTKGTDKGNSDHLNATSMTTGLAVGVSTSLILIIVILILVYLHQMRRKNKMHRKKSNVTQNFENVTYEENNPQTSCAEMQLDHNEAESFYEEVASVHDSECDSHKQLTAEENLYDAVKPMCSPIDNVTVDKY